MGWGHRRAYLFNVPSENWARNNYFVKVLVYTVCWTSKHLGHFSATENSTCLRTLETERHNKQLSRTCTVLKTRSDVMEHNLQMTNSFWFLFIEKIVVFLNKLFY